MRADGSGDFEGQLPEVANDISSERASPLPRRYGFAP